MLLPDAAGGIGGALLGVGSEDWGVQSPLLPGALPGALPPGDYRFASTLRNAELATLAWLAGSYRFGRYKSENNAKPKRLVLPDGVNRGRVQALAEALFLGRDLINTPSNDLGPAELEMAARDIGAEHGAAVKVTEGSGLLADNFPMIYAVGRASDRPPRLIDLRWGSEHAPKVTIVGKGICFDTGGLDIKPGNAMALMKKDMGGAALRSPSPAGHAGEASVAATRADSRGREFDLRQLLQAWRRAAEPKRHDGGDRQHRCGRAPRARRRA